MKDFHFEQSIAEYVAAQQKSGKVAFVLVSLITLVSLIFSPGVNWSIAIVAIAVVLFMVFRENKIMQQIKNCPQQEKWVISLKGSSLSWHSPKSLSQFLAETSFEIDIDEIETIQSTYDSDDVVYRLVLKNGDCINLNTNSHLELSAFIENLKDRGISCLHISDFRN